MRSILFLSIILCCRLFASEEDIFCATEKKAIISDKTTLLNTTYTLKILLVQFTNIRHDPDYTAEDWQNLFFSQWTYVTPNMTSPDGEAVYGSMRDYYSIMSDGEFELTGYILNPDTNADGQPDWLTLPHSKEHYYNSNLIVISNESKNIAMDAGLDISVNKHTKLCIIYAGHMYRGNGGLKPYSYGSYYIMSEKFAMGAPYDQERPDATFAGIGVHCHELGHLLGWKDTYHFAQNNTFWTLMAGGQYNRKAHAPAPLCPEFRIQKGWITPVEVKNDITFFADYDLKDPEVFKLCFSENPARYFLIENRSFDAQMNFNGVLVRDYNNFLPWQKINNPPDLPKQGLLVWAFRKKLSNPPDPDWSYLIQADGENNALNKFNTAENDQGLNYHTGDSGDPFPGYTGNRIFSSWSFPQNLSSGPSPDSYPSSNVGFEIVEMGVDYIKVDLYVNNPQMIRPQTPWNIDTLFVKDHPQITWEANCEPDFSMYEVWKNGSFFKELNSTFFTDISETASIGNPRNKAYVDYNIMAKDKDGNRSYTSKTIRFVVENSENLTSIGRSGVANRENYSKTFYLDTNFPNPFNPTTNISFTLAEQSQVSLKVFNTNGKLVATLLNEIKPGGLHTITFNGSSLASGLYLYSLTAYALQSKKRFSKTRRMILVK